MDALYGWVGRILLVDLSSGRIEKIETAPYTKDFIGGRGIAAKLMWDITNKDPSARPLIFMTGPLAGTVAPFGGRTVVAGYAPQGYPHEWYSRSTFGGHWGPELKYAGYDGVVVIGESSTPVYLSIRDESNTLLDASAIWGCGIYETQEKLRSELGSQTRIVTIGQSGENQSRIAVIQTETESAAGQGGFGAVMGKKRLKAIAVQGSGAVRIADPDTLLRYSKAIRDELRMGSMFAQRTNGSLGKNARYKKRGFACTQQCGVACVASYYYTDVPGPTTGELRSGHTHCTAPGFEGRGKDSFYNWNLGFEAGFDVASMANDYGLNHWELHFAIIPWLRYCKENAIQQELDGLEIDINSAKFWAKLMRSIAYRKGVGSVLAEGGYRAATDLGWAPDYVEELYAGWGYAGHWDGHGDRINRIVFPFWLVSALQWAVDTRDPISSSHGYSHASMLWSPLQSEVDVGSPTGAGGHGKGYLTWNKLQEISERVYGNRWTLDPYAEYEGKAHGAVWHVKRSAIKDSLLVCDWMFPCLFSLNHADLWARAGGIEGLDFERHLFTAATGLPSSKSEFCAAG